MKKNLLKTVLLLSVASISAIYANFATELDLSSQLSMKNVEALAEGNEDKNYNICYSESKVVVGKTYYDCGDCPNKVYDEQGKGSKSKCFY